MLQRVGHSFFLSEVGDFFAMGFELLFSRCTCLRVDCTSAPVIVGTTFDLRRMPGESQPDIELCTARASRRHALLLRNFHGQVFLMDLGSAHGTFLKHKRLQPHTTVEWKQGMRVFFADTSVESFEIRPTSVPPAIVAPVRSVPPSVPQSRGTAGRAWAGTLRGVVAYVVPAFISLPPV